MNKLSGGKIKHLNFKESFSVSKTRNFSFENSTCNRDYRDEVSRSTTEYDFKYGSSSKR